MLFYSLEIKLYRFPNLAYFCILDSSELIFQNSAYFYSPEKMM